MWRCVAALSNGYAKGQSFRRQSGHESEVNRWQRQTSPATSITGHEFDPAEPVMFILPVRVQSHVPGSYEGFDLRFRIPRENFAIRRLSRCLDPALISAAPHYGLRYGCAPATGDFQRLRGRPPLVSPLKSCMGRFHGGNTGSNPVGGRQFRTNNL